MSFLLLLNLFWSFFKVGLFSFGGGYAMISLMESEIIAHHGWLTPSEFIDIIVIAETTPGPIAINSATYVGFRIAGIVGSTVATIGVVSPSLIILLALGTFLMNTIKEPRMGSIIRGLRPAVIVLILLAAVSLGKTGLVDWATFAIATTLFIFSTLFKVNPFYLIAAGAVLGLIFYPY
jgi:chromate transporter